MRPIVVASLLFGSCLCAEGGIIASWTFPTDTQIVYPSNGSVSSPYAANIGTGALTVIRQPNPTGSVVGGSGAGITTFENSSIPAVDDGTGALSLGASGTITRKIVLDFEFSTLNMQDIMVSIDGRRGSFNGTTPLSAQFSIDGGATFIPNVGFGLPTFDAWHRSTADFSTLDAIENQSSVLIRMTGKQGNYDPHTTRLDNFTISATAVPEVTTLTFAMSGAAFLALVRLKNSIRRADKA